MNPSLCTATLFLIALSGAQPVEAQTPEAQRQGWGMTLAYDGMFIRKPIIEVKNIPLDVRQVPIHPEDEDIGRINFGQPISAIPDGPLNPSSMFYANVSFLGTLRRGVNQIGFGLSYGYLFAQRPNWDNPRNTREYNYVLGGSNRGYGAALTY